ncbi:hypothetical protein KR032_008699, partial [Drosophila birchii]
FFLGELEEPITPPENEDLAIIITQFFTPHQFSYVRLKDVMASASLVFQIEQTLVKHCTKEKNERRYLVNQKVIVLYKPRSPAKLLRGEVKKRVDDEYLVWIFDYGFFLCCSSLDMWPLPEILTTSFWDIKKGGIAYIMPSNNKWSKTCLRVFDKLLEDSIQLNFEVVCQGCQGTFGKLIFKTAGQSNVFQDGAEFLVSRKHAHRHRFMNASLPTSEAFCFELAEINDPLIEARPRVKNIIQLVSLSSNSFLHYPNNIQQPVNSQESVYSNLSFDITKMLGKSKSWSDSDECNLSRPSNRAPMLDKTLENRLDVHVPSSGKLLRNKFLASKEGCVQTALDRPSIENNKISLLEAEVYEDAQLPIGDDFWENLQSAKRSSSSATSEESFCTINNATQASESSESLYSSAESLLSIKSIAAQEKSEPIKATSTTSSATSSEASFSTIKAASSDACQNAPENLGTNQEKATSTTSSPSTLAVLAHSRQTVNPVSCLAELPFCQEIRRSLNDLNIRTVLPMQMYSWPHLLNGGSVVLVNDCGKGRSWSYLPAVCSSVLCSFQNSAISRGHKLGPLAILLVDSIHRAKALASNCLSLMSSSDTQMLKVVNTHAHPMANCQMMLLNSCGILVTNPNHLLDLMGHEIAMIDPKRLEYFIFDDFDRMRQSTPKALNEVLRKLNGMATSPTMQLILVAQQWHAKEFEKLLKDIPKPLALFGNFLEAAMYGGLKLKFSLKASSMKKNLLLKFLAEQKALKKRTLIYCKNKIELNVLHGSLTTAGHECVDLSNFQNQSPHQLLIASDELELPRREVRNIEVLIHFSLPHTWSKFTERFHVMADQIPNYFTATAQDEKKPPLLSYLLLDNSNSREFNRLTEFLRVHGFETNGAPWMKCQPQVDDSIPYCPYFLSSGECAVACNKRHHFIQADMPPPGNPLQQEGTIIRCKLYKVYDPGHMAVWPMEYQIKGSSEWVEAPHPINKWLAAVEMSMGTKQNVHSPCHLGDVCVLHHQGHFKRVKIVDIPSSGPVTVQIMDYGTELMRVNSRNLLQCPEEKLGALPQLAMDIRVSGVSARQGKWLNDTTQWVQQSLSSVTDRQQLQITVDFAMLNVVYAKEVTIVEECPKMRTGVYKLLLRKELINRGFGQMDSQSDRQLRSLHEQQKKANEQVEVNKENIQLNNRKVIHSENTKTYPFSQKIMEKKPEAIMEPKPTEGDSEPKELPNTKTIKIDSPNEKISPSSPEAGNDQPLNSTEALCNALMQELCAPKKQDNHMFLQSILEGIKSTNPKKLTKQEDAPQEASQEPSAKPVNQSLQYSTISKGAVRPRVKWHQTESHIELTIEQQVPEYELCLESNTLMYSVSTSSPPQQFVLPMLGEVRIVSQKQHGYYLRIKLAKVGILGDWPTLFNSVYAQKKSPWLTYDAEQADEPSPPPGLVMWERYSRYQVNNNDPTSEDEDLGSDFCEPDVECSDS